MENLLNKNADIIAIIGNVISEIFLIVKYPAFIRIVNS